MKPRKNNRSTILLADLTKRPRIYREDLEEEWADLRIIGRQRTNAAMIGLMLTRRVFEGSLKSPRA